ncbi:MAG: ABC-type antimicrobial peptide transport system permease subunit [Spirosomataceae bacterium]|jgi:ABC-type antimicrobial peptide transport system permease subunit
MAVTIIVGLWVNDMLNYDGNFPKKEKLAMFWQHQTFNGEVKSSPSMPIPLEKELKSNYGEYFKHIVISSWTQGRYLGVGEKTINKTGKYMQPGATDMLDVEVITGQKNGLKDVKSIMLSETTAEALFGKSNAVGEIVKVNNLTDMKVTGIYKDFPFSSSFNDVHFLMPWEQYMAESGHAQNVIDNWGDNSWPIFVELTDGYDVADVSAVIRNIKFDKADVFFQEYKPTLQLLLMKDWYLRNLFNNGVQDGGRIQLVWLFGTIGAFVLFLACINFINLSTARSEKRAKEVGIRKSIGSFRGQIIAQFLSESLLVVSFAFVAAVALVLLFLPGFNNLADKQIEFPWGNLNFWLLSSGFILFTSLISGSYPAIYLSSFQPVKVLKGTFKAGRFAALPRKVLVVLQFTVSIALIIGTVLVLKQINFTKNRPIGYSKEGLVQIPAVSTEFEGKADFMRTQFLESGAVTEMATSNSPATEIYSNRSGYRWEGKEEGFQEDFAWTAVSPEYMKVLGAKIIAGRDFSRDMATDSNAVIVNQTFVKYIGKMDVIGLQLRSDDENSTASPQTIIGVVDDILVQSPFESVKQGVYVFGKADQAAFYNLRLNPNKSASENIARIESVFKQHFPNLPFDYQFVDEEFGEKFELEERIGSLASVFTVLAILISCLGLFGLASFVAEQRTKEIGIRKVLGATVGNLWAMLSKDFVLLVAISIFIAAPIAWYGMDAFLNRYTYRTELAWWVFFLAGAGAVLITLLTVSFQAIKTAVKNPVESLKNE